VSLGCCGLLVLVMAGFTSSISSNKALAIDWYWGHCDFSAGATCARCTMPNCGGGGPGGKPIPVGGVAGCDKLPGIQRGLGCPGQLGWCAWHINLCGVVEEPDCCLDPVTLFWEPCCPVTEEDCEGC
jgi:hypothetical protein